MTIRSSTSPSGIIHRACRSAWSLSAVYGSLIVASMVSSSCVTAAQEPINCALPHTDQRLSQCTTVRYASEFPNCLKAADISGHSCIVMDTDLSFCADEPSIPITAVFDRSDRTLDCNGGIIDHGWGRNKLPGGTATTVSTRSPAVRLFDDRSLSDITVRDCTIRGTNHIGIQSTRFFGGELGGNSVLDANEALPVAHHGLTFEDLLIQDTGLGIYLGTYSDRVTINRVHVDNSQRIAIYSEAGSHRVTIRDSIISNNNTREAIAIDSTYDSEVSNTLFVNKREVRGNVSGSLVMGVNVNVDDGD